MQPYSFNFLIISIIGLTSFLSVLFMPRLDNYFLDIIVRSSIISLIFISISYLTNVSDELNSNLKKLFRKIID